MGFKTLHNPRSFHHQPCATALIEVPIMNFIQTLAIVSLFVGVAHAQQAVQGDELKKFVLAEKGTTWTLSNGSRLSFFQDGTLLDCTGKQGFESCDDGVYTITDSSIERRYNTWFKEVGGSRKAVVKKDGGKLIFNGFEVVKHSEPPTLVPASAEEIFSLRGKDFQVYFKDEGLSTHNLNSDMTLFSCSKSGCGRTFPVKVSAPWVEFTYVSIYGSSFRNLVVVDSGRILWNGKQLFSK